MKNWDSNTENFMLAVLGGCKEAVQVRVNAFAARRKLSPGAAAFILLKKVLEPKERSYSPWDNMYPFSLPAKVLEPTALLPIGKEVA